MMAKPVDESPRCKQNKQNTCKVVRSYLCGARPGHSRRVCVCAVVVSLCRVDTVVSCGRSSGACLAADSMDTLQPFLELKFFCLRDSLLVLGCDHLGREALLVPFLCLLGSIQLGARVRKQEQILWAA